MKFLVIFLLFAFSVHADEVRVRAYRNGKLIAEDRGENVTVLSLRQKMLKKGVDIAAPDVEIVEDNYTQAQAVKKQARLSQFKGPRRNEVIDLMIEDFLKRNPGVE